MTKLHAFILQAQTKCARFLRNEEGASGIEYALIAAMVAVVLATFVPGVSAAISTVMTEIQTVLTTAADAVPTDG